MSGIHLLISRSPAMSTPQDLADALREVADYLDTTVGPSTGPIRDGDGVLVGRWEMGDAS
jgi:hypothetical protein